MWWQIQCYVTTVNRDLTEQRYITLLQTHFLQGHLGRSMSYMKTANVGHLSAYTINTAKVHGAEKYLLVCRTTTFVLSHRRNIIILPKLVFRYCPWSLLYRLECRIGIPPPLGGFSILILRKSHIPWYRLVLWKVQAKILPPCLTTWLSSTCPVVSQEIVHLELKVHLHFRWGR